MTILEMLEQSAILTVLGVGIVFSFLLIMIICVTLVGKIIRFLESGKDDEAQESTTQESTTATQAVNKAENGPIIAAITAAVNEYRKSQEN
jgi:oxaloacetate decarboxylase gamma subunit